MSVKQIYICEFPEPVREPLKDGERYYVMSLMIDYIMEHTWQGTDLDFEWMELGIIQRTEDGANQHRAAVLSITNQYTN